MPQVAAKHRRYLELQPPWLRAWIVLDVDRDGAWCAAAEAGLPAPTCMVINPENGRGHLIYGLAVPVLLGPGNRDRPQRYLVDVERAITARLQADVGYAGLLCKNPLHPYWVAVWSDHCYYLQDLHDWLGDLNEYRVMERTVGVGRNVETFDAVRAWACPGGDGNVLQHKADGGSLDTWRQACTGAAEAFTAAHHRPELQRSECRWIGRSIAKWTWARITQERFSEIQAARGRGGKAVQAKRSERKRRVQELAEQGKTLEAIAAELEVSRSTVARDLSGVEVGSVKAISGCRRSLGFPVEGSMRWNRGA